MIIRMSNEIYMGMNKCLNELQDNLYNKVNEIKKAMQDLKEDSIEIQKFLGKKEFEILEMKSSRSQVKVYLEVSLIDWIKLKTEY
jgi:hypothetical protein